MDRRSYENVLSDLEAQIKVRRAEAEKLNKEILQSENVISVLRMRLSQENLTTKPQINKPELTEHTTIDSTSLVGNEYTEKNQSKISLVAACEKILQSEEKSLYITDLIEKMKDYGRLQTEDN